MSFRSQLALWSVVLSAGWVLMALASSAFATATFHGLGDLPGGEFASTPHAISADGSTVVGYSQSASGQEAFRWTRSEGIEGLGDLPGGTFRRALDVNRDGDVIVGWGQTASGTQPVRWTRATGTAGLSGTVGSASGVSGDGSVIVGTRQLFGSDPAWYFEAYRWTAEGGVQGLAGAFGQPYHDSSARDISGDGLVIVGEAATSAGREAFRWTAQIGFQGLGDLPGGMYSSATDISNDGSTIVGWSTSAGDLNDIAFRWTAEGGMESLGVLPGKGGSVPMDVSGDGSIVIGRSLDAAFIWDEARGMRSLQDVLESEHGLALGEWRLFEATGISADGSTIVGYGFNPSGQVEGWIAVIPEPGSVALLGLSCPVLLARRWRPRKIQNT